MGLISSVFDEGYGAGVLLLQEERKIFVRYWYIFSEENLFFLKFSCSKQKMSKVIPALPNNI